MERSLFRPDDRADHPSDFHIQRLGDFQEGIKCGVGFPALQMPNPGTAQPGQFSQAILGNPLPHARLDQPGNDGVNNFLFCVMRHARDATVQSGARVMALKGHFHHIVSQKISLGSPMAHRYAAGADSTSPPEQKTAMNSEPPAKSHRLHFTARRRGRTFVLPVLHRRASPPPQKSVSQRRGRLFLLAVAFAATIPEARADTFVYDDAGRLQSATQTSGLTQTYTPDAEGNLLSISTGGTDATGNGIPDWWENYWFGTSGIDPLASAAGDGMGNLMKYVLGLNPLAHYSGQPLVQSWQTYTDGKTYPYLTYVCSIGAASLVVPEQTIDLAAWYYGALNFALVSVQNLGDGTEQIVIRSLVPFGATPRLYFRLKAPSP